MEEWQRVKTLEYVDRIAADARPDRPILVEGQMRLAFLRAALAEPGLTGARVILVDCDAATRTDRLTRERRQPDLANPRMMGWAAFLRREARSFGCEVLDTSSLSLAGGVEVVLRALGVR